MKKTPAKREPKKLTAKSLKIFTGVKAGIAGPEFSDFTGKKKTISVSDTGRTS